MRFGLRAGPRPHWIASTTPKPKALIKKLDKGEIPNVIVTRATTFDNPHLPKHIRAALEETYGGQQLGAQELYARIIEQDENALFTRANIEQYRVKDIADVPDLKRITVGVDPSGGAGEQGIVVVGLHIQNEMIPQGPGLGAKLKSTKTGYVLDDRTVRLSPAEWGRRVVQAYLDWDADDVVVERNFGGDMAKATIVGAAEAMGVTISVKEVVASRGKRVRAEPVAALASRGQWRFVGTHPELEDQCCVWTPEADYSPDRLDAMVWPAWHMKIATAMQLVGASFPGQQMAQERIAPTQ
jgi:phage terminase large subunit-like protein